MGRANNVGFGKFLIMVLVTWLTPFPGLANLFFLWPYPYYRSGAITAIGVSVVCYIVISVLTGVGLVALADLSYVIAAVIIVAMKVWMTIDAVNAFIR